MTTTEKTRTAGNWTVTLARHTVRVFDLDSRTHSPELVEFEVAATRTAVGHNVFRGDVEGTEWSHESTHQTRAAAEIAFDSACRELTSDRTGQPSAA